MTEAYYRILQAFGLSDTQHLRYLICQLLPALVGQKPPLTMYLIFVTINRNYQTSFILYHFPPVQCVKTLKLDHGVQIHSNDNTVIHGQYRLQLDAALTIMIKSELLHGNN